MTQAITDTDGRSRRWATAGKRAKARVLVGIAGAALTATTAVIVYNTDKNDSALLDNSDGNADSNWNYNELADLDENDLTTLESGPYGGWHSTLITCEGEVSGQCPTDGTGPTSRPDNGPGPVNTMGQIQGQFRIACDVSHFAFDDMVLKPGQPGESHNHMFWGNTQVNADTTFNGYPGNPSDPHDLINHGGGSCQSNAMNRSAYWVPTLYQGGEDGKPVGHTRSIVVPKSIIIYYKSRYPERVQLLPAGVEMLGGNLGSNGVIDPNLDRAHWSCNDGAGPQPGTYRDGAGGTFTASQDATIPIICPAGTDILATLEFPQCLATDNGLITGTPIINSPNFTDHTSLVNDQDPCPASHPYRVPQIEYLIRFEYTSQADVETWRLSSDPNWFDETVQDPGATLHGDWRGGWIEAAHQAWLDGCFDPDNNPAGGLFTNIGVNNFGGPRNCSLGQTGTNQEFFDTGGQLDASLNWIPGTGKSRYLKRISTLNQVTLPGLLDDPCGTCRPNPN